MAPEIIYDPSSRPPRKSPVGSSISGRSNLMSPKHMDKRGKLMSGVSANQQESEGEELDINKMLKEIQYLGSSTMTWKERKKLENEKVVALGGKPAKKHRIPLSVAKVPMKKQKQREQKKIEEERILGRFSRQSNNRRVEKRRVEDRVLRATEGHFSKGVLNVKHLLGQKPSGSDYGTERMTGSKGKTMKGKGKGRKGKGKGKGKGNKRRN